MGYDTKSGGGEVEWEVRSYWQGWVLNNRLDFRKNVLLGDCLVKQGM